MKWLAGVVAFVALAPLARADDAPVYGPPAAPPPAAPPPPAAAPAPPPPAPMAYLPPPPPWQQPAPRPLGVTFEAAIGLGVAGASGGGESVTGVGGPALGIGGFVSPTIALGVRLSGFTLIDHGFAYLGTLAPHLQAWLSDQVYVGGGIGLGVLAECPTDGSCREDHTWGLDARLGYAFAPRGVAAASLSIEMTSLGVSGETIHSFSVLVGTQTF